MGEIISIRDLSKNFGRIQALNRVSLSINKGEIFGLLGPNAAGKTTLLRCLLGLLKPNKGKIFFEDKPLTSEVIQRKFGFLPENFLPYPNLSAWELLKGFSPHKKNKDKIFTLLEIVGLGKSKYRRIKEYSRGMIQRLGIAQALLNEPEVLVLDEPTLGLDPIGQRQILELLKNLKAQGKTVFFSSHILSQVEKICDQIGVISNGRLIFQGKTEDLLRDSSETSLEEAFIKVVEERG